MKDRLGEPETTTPSEAEIATLIAVDPTIAAGVMCQQEDKLIAAEKEIERLQAELTFWRDGLSASEVTDNMKLWELATHG